MPRPSRSGDFASDSAQVVFQVLEENGRLGFAILDEDFVTRWRFGSLASWIPVNQDICTATPVFFGLEQELLRLKDEPGTAALLPKVGLNRTREDGGKFSIEVFWDARSRTYILALYNPGAGPGFESDFVTQVRRTRIAEENCRKARELLSEQQGLLELLMDHAPAALAIFDREMRYLFSTRRWMETLGLDCEPLAGRPYEDTFPHLSPEARRCHRLCLEGAMPGSIEELIRKRDGSTAWVRWNHRPWHRGDGSAGGIVVSCDVLTGLIEKRKALEARNAELTRANRGLEEFASMISHDLKAPLNVLRTELDRLETALGAAPPQAVRRRIARMRRQAAHMTGMVSQLLEYARFTGTSPIVRTVDLCAAIKELQRFIPGAAAFRIVCREPCPALDVAPAAFDLVLRNLIENAVKHHDRRRGRIAVSAEDGGQYWKISVSDDGPGIVPGSRGLLPGALPGTDVEREWEREWRGSGIGLALVKKTVEAQGGRIAVAPAPPGGRGVTFTVLWPKPGTDGIPPD